MKSLLCLLAAALACALQAAPLQRDLAPGLVYERIHALPGDLPPPSALASRVCILDLRYVRGDRRDGAALLAWLRSRASLRTPVFLLANQGTSEALLQPLDSPDAVLGLVIIGAAGSQFDPDITLQVAPGLEHRAYQALESGTPIASLYIRHTDKPRNDEETLEKARLSGDDDEADWPEAPQAAKPAGPPQLIDPVLQRAVQLYEALVALRRIPASG